MSYRLPNIDARGGGHMGTFKKIPPSNDTLGPHILLKTTYCTLPSICLLPMCVGSGSITMIYFSVIALEEAKMPGNLSEVIEFHCNLCWWITPQKMNIEPEYDGLEDEFPLSGRGVFSGSVSVNLPGCNMQMIPDGHPWIQMGGFQLECFTSKSLHSNWVLHRTSIKQMVV